MTVGHSNECLDGGEAGKSLSFLLLVILTDTAGVKKVVNEF